MYEKQTKGNFSERDMIIMRKAKAYGVTALANPMLAQELFNLTFSKDLDKSDMKEILRFYSACDVSVKAAQSSSDENF